MAFYNEILRQLGGNRFLAMTGCKNLVFCDKENWLRMELQKNQSGAKWLKITLNGLDLYDVEFIGNKRTTNKELAALGVKITENNPFTIKKFTNIYNDMLVDIFEKQTGFYTSL
jgi:acetolactate synthase small subunit